MQAWLLFQQELFLRSCRTHWTCSAPNDRQPELAAEHLGAKDSDVALEFLEIKLEGISFMSPTHERVNDDAAPCLFDL